MRSDPFLWLMVDEFGDLDHGIPRLPAWYDHAACADHPDPDLWWPSGKGVQIPNTVLETCRGCPVRSECLDVGLSIPQCDDVGGIWGGTTRNERTWLRRNGQRDAA